MFLVEKAHLSSHFRSTAKKSPSVAKNYQLDARLFDDKVNLHLKTLTPAKNSSAISLSWMSAAVSCLSTVHSEAQDQISSLISESDDSKALYMDFSLKVLDLCNLISSAVQKLTERRLLLNLSLRLLNFSDQIPSTEKLTKAKDALARSVNDAKESAPEKGLRAAALIGELTEAIGSLPRGKPDLIRRTFHALGVLTVFIAGVLVSVLYGKSDLVKVRSPAEFLWSDSVNDLQDQIFDLIKPKPNQNQAPDMILCLSEIDDIKRSAAAVREILNGGDEIKDRVGLEKAVEELRTAAKRFSDGVDGLTNGVNGLFRNVMKMRNGVMDSVRVGPM